MRIERLRFQNVSTEIDNSEILSNISFTMWSEEILCLLTCNTAVCDELIEIFGMKKKSRTGLIYFDGELCQEISDHCYIVHRTPQLIADMSIAENFFLTSDIYYKGSMVNRKLIEQLTTEMLKNAGLKHMKATMKVRELTSVEKHYIELLKVLVSDKSILVIEEITNDFRAYELLRLKELLRYIHRQGMDILYITDKADNIMDLADRITVIHTEGALENYACEDNRSFLNKVFQNVPLVSEDKMIRDNSIMRLQYHSIERKTVDYDLYENEIVGIYDQMWKFCPLIVDYFMGKKSTDKLAIHYQGKNLMVQNRAEALQKGIAIIEEFQGDLMFHNMSFIDNVTILADEQLVGAFRNKDKKQFVARTVLEKINAADLLDIIPTSGNMPYVGKEIQMIIEIARVLCRMPRVIFFSGSYWGIHGHGNSDRFAEVIQLLRKEGITCVLLAKHMEQLENICDRMIYI